MRDQAMRGGGPRRRVLGPVAEGRSADPVPSRGTTSGTTAGGRRPLPRGGRPPGTSWHGRHHPRPGRVRHRRRLHGRIAERIAGVLREPARGRLRARRRPTRPRRLRRTGAWAAPCTTCRGCAPALEFLGRIPPARHRSTWCFSVGGAQPGRGRSPGACRRASSAPGGRAASRPPSPAGPPHIRRHRRHGGTSAVGAGVLAADRRPARRPPRLAGHRRLGPADRRRGVARAARGRPGAGMTSACRSAGCQA